MFKKLLILYLFFAKAFSTPLNPDVFASQEGDPNIFFEGACAITGEWSFSQQDLFVEGFEPISFKRIYLSGDGKGKFGGWTFFPHQWLVLQNAKNAIPTTAIAIEPSGSEFFYISDDNHQFHIQVREGVANTSRGEISARTNVYNQYLERSGDWICLFACDKTQRFYEYSHSYGEDLRFLLKKEQLPNGNWRIYSYDLYNRLTAIRTTTPNQDANFAECAIHYLFSPREKQDFDVIGNNKKISYRFSINSGEFSFPLTSVSSSFFNEKCDYFSQGNSLVVQLTDRYFTDGRWIKATYFPKYGSKSNATNAGKINALFAPRGAQGEVIPIYYFSYNSSDRTEVTDADGNKTVIIFSSNHLPKQIEYIDRLGIIKKTYLMHWNEKGELIRKLYQGMQGEILSIHEYTYDKKGNILCETISEDYSGTGKRSTYHIWKEYDSEDRLIKIEEETGKITQYEYVKNTTLITAKKIGDVNKIWLREFFLYDQDHVLIRHITDDGTGLKYDDLTAVSHRQIQEITPRKASPFFGMTESIEEKIWNFDTQQEEPLVKTIFHYNSFGKVERKEIFDIQNRFSHCWKYTYDEMGRVIQEINPLEQITVFVYDNHGNLIEKKLPGRAPKYYSYDVANRCIKTTQENYSTNFTYDVLGHCIQSLDNFNHLTTYKVDCFGNILEEHLPSEMDEKLQSIQPIILRSFDSEGRVIQENDVAGNRTKKRYTSHGKIGQITYPDQTTETFHYNCDGTLAFKVNQEGVKTEYKYDILGHMISKMVISPDGKNIQQETWEYNAFSLLNEIDAAGQKTKYSYDFAGRKKSVVFPDGSSKRFFYNHLGQVEKVIEQELVTVFYYDVLSRMIEKKEETLEGKILSKIAFTYDENGEISKTIKYCTEGEIIFSKTYDSLGRLIEESDSYGNSKTIEYDFAILGGIGSKIITKLPSGMIKEEIQNQHGKTLSKRVFSSSKELLFETRSFYTINQNLSREEIDQYFSSTIPIKVTRSWQYDVKGRAIKQSETQNNSTKQTSFFYTSSGLLKKTILPENITIYYDYDFLNRITSIRSSDQTISYSIHYNALSSPIEIIDRINHRIGKRTYDAANRLIEETLLNGLVIKNAYDLQGRRTSLTFPDQSSVQYVYGPKHLKKIKRITADGNLKYQHSILGYDLGGFPKQQSMTEDLGTIGFTMDHQLQLIPQSLWISRDSSFSFSQGDFFQSIIQESIPLNISHFTFPDEEIENYQFDALGRLITIRTPQKEICYTYDFWNRCMNKTVYEKGKKISKSYAFLYDEQEEIGMIDLMESTDITNPTFKQLKIRTSDFINSGDGAIAYEFDGRVFVPVHDVFGNVSKLLSVNLHLAKESYTYNPSGQEKILDFWEDPISFSKVGNPWRFKSKRIDEDSGMIFFKDGYYKPNWMQFFPFENDENLKNLLKTQHHP